MRSLIDHARNLPATILDQRQEFAQLAHGQGPTLFISCSDSRAIPGRGAVDGLMNPLSAASPPLVPRWLYTVESGQVLVSSHPTRACRPL
jgi:hypothetical protein